MAYRVSESKSEERVTCRDTTHLKKYQVEGRRGKARSKNGIEAQGGQGEMTTPNK